MSELEPDCDKCYGERNEDCPPNCLTSHIRYEGCPTCGNEDVFHELIDGNLLCGVCSTLLKVRSPEGSTQ